MKLVTITLQFLADDEASGRARAERILGEHNDCRFAEPTIEDASLDDEDDILGHDQAARMRCMDALRRTSMPLLIEVAKEVRDGPHRAAENGYEDDEESLKEHLHDLYTDRVRAALDAEFPDVTDDQHEAAMHAVVDWAFGPHALDGVWLDQEDCDELREAWESHRFGNTDGRSGEDAVRHFVYDGELEARVPRLSAMADEAYRWLVDCVRADSWLPALEGSVARGGPECPGCGAFKARDCQCTPVWDGFAS